MRVFGPDGFQGAAFVHDGRIVSATRNLGPATTGRSPGSSAWPRRAGGGSSATSCQWTASRSPAPAPATGDHSGWNCLGAAAPISLM